MKIESLRIENFRGFKDEIIHFDNYACFIGPNGAGKSTILTALNVFFRQYKDSGTDLSKLSIDDYHHKNPKNPIRITVTFTDLSDQAKADLKDYVRQGKLIVSAEAHYDATMRRAEVRQYGNRLGMEAFRRYFEADKEGVSAPDLKTIFEDLRSSHPGLPAARTKADMAGALQEFEAAHPEECTPIPSEDQFYGAARGANRLSPHLQWVFVPAVKDITEEGVETKSTGLGQLLARTIRSKVDFASKIGEIRETVQAQYQSMLESEQAVLDDLSVSIAVKLKDWAHPDATARILWDQDADQSVKVDEPVACIKLGERGFEGGLARFGHGMQRSFMLSLLQELASTAQEGSPTLILAIEEPELYQHPPQTRYLADLLQDLSRASAQVIICTHSPHFIPGDDFECVRLVREFGNPRESKVAQLKYADLANSLADAGQKFLKETGILAKLYPQLNVGISEMFFCKVLVLVEGIEDVAYLSSYLALTGVINDFRRYGCHIVPVGGKSEIIKPLAMARALKIPVYTVFDADTDQEKAEYIQKNKVDNAVLLKLQGHEDSLNWPEECVWRDNLTMWRTSITAIVSEELGAQWKDHEDAAAAFYGNAGGLKKNPLAVSRALESAWAAELKSASLCRLTTQILKFAQGSLA